MQLQSILLWVSHHGYIGLFSLLMLGIFGIPVPDETLLTFAGYLVFKGELHLLPTIATAFAGSIVGITFSYILGRFGGYYLLQRYGRFIHVAPGNLDRIHEWFGRVGKWSLAFGYFLPGIRHLTAIAAGTSRMRLISFMLFAYTGALIWTTIFILVGLTIGEHWQIVATKIHQHLVIGAIAVASLIIIIFLAHRWLGHRILHGKSK